MRGWKGLGQMRHQHPARIRRVDLGDLVTYQAVTSTVWGLWLDQGRLWVLLDLPKGRAWVPSDDCESLEVTA
jgi:hypothetical protein